MNENKKNSSLENKDFKERFEFRLFVDGKIICQRYFKIINFNPVSLKSFNLIDTIENCADMIKRDLNSKTQIYLSYVAPQIFSDFNEMKEYFEKHSSDNNLVLGEGLVLKNMPDSNYCYIGDGKYSRAKESFDEGDFSKDLTSEDKSVFQFVFLVDGKETCSVVWDGIYPKYIRKSVDLSNRKGRFENEKITDLTFEQYLLYKMVEGRNDLVWLLIKDICSVCSHENTWYTCSVNYGDTIYDNRKSPVQILCDRYKLKKK